ncbi:MAG: hypothetical protein WC682_02170 [Parcubacteria group bacterium]|jgi:hypothetical protein
MTIKFSELNKEIQLRRCVIPQAVFTTLSPDDETDKQVIERQEKFLKLPENIKDKLTSNETVEKIKNVGAHYKLELLQMAPIARAIRSYYFGELKLEDFASVISKESNISLTDAQNISRYIIERVIKRDAAKPVVAQTVKMTISQAMEKYPEIKMQILTSFPIESDGQIVKPTVGNWARDYFTIVGAGNRDMMKRSSYLYHSKNVKNLNTADRQRLSNVLKSLDEGFLFRVDPSKREVIFEGIAPALIKKTEAPVYARPILEKKEETKPDYEKKIVREDEENKGTVINHVQGNSWDLKSSHFVKENNAGTLIGNKKREDFDSINLGENNQDNIKFSSPQQLPVEKENDLGKPNFRGNQEVENERLKNFFGKIEPIE